MSQRALADKLGLASDSSVTMWESGERTPRAALLPKLAAALGCTIDDLYRESLSTMDSPAAE